MEFFNSNYSEIVDKLLMEGKTTISYDDCGDIKLSENFTLAEFLYSDTAIRLGIKNEMPIEYLPRLQYLVTNMLQPLRDKFGSLKITSGYRSVKLCLAIGSDQNSNHTKATTADVEPLEPGITNLMLFEYIEKNMEYYELIAEYFPNGWVHVSVVENNDRHLTKLKDKNHNYEIVENGYVDKIYNV